MIDPRRGRPAVGVISASVVTDDATTADALATALLVGGPELARLWCADHPETAAVLVLEEDPRTLLLVGSPDRIQLEPATGVRLAVEGDA